MQNNDNKKEEYYRYPGSDSFDDKSVDRKLFNGREDEKKGLLHLVLSESLVVLYSKSGIGKSSLLKAGVFKELRKKGFFPILIRLNEPTKKITSTVNEIMEVPKEIKEVIYETIEKRAHENEILIVPGIKDSLWQYFNTTAYIQKSEKNRRLIPVLVFDQFEEIFTLDYSNVQRIEFITQFASLARGILPEELRHSLSDFDREYFAENIPELKIIISIREDFLPLLEELSREIPTILNNRFRLLPLNPHQAREAIVEPALLDDQKLITEKYKYEEKALNAIINFLRKKKIGEKIIDTEEIEPFQLQLLCRHIELNVLKAKVENKEELIIQEKDLGGEKGMEKILKNFYDDLLKHIPPSKRKAVRKLCEKKLINHTGRRLSVEEESIIKSCKISKDLLATLIKNRLLRSEPRTGSKYYELSHDTLVKPILDSHKKYRRKRLRRLLFVPPALILLLTIMAIPSFNYHLGNNYQQEGKYLEAANAYKKYVKHHPEKYYLNTIIGENYFKISEYDSALKYYKIAINNSPYAELNLVDQGIKLKNNGKFDDAERFFKEIKYDNKQKDSLINETHKLKETFEKDAKQPMEILKSDPNNVSANRDLGKLFLKYEYYGEAIRYLKKALKSDSTSGEIHNEIANVFVNQSNFDSAIYYYRKAISIEPENMIFQCNLSYAYYSHRDFDKSIENSLKAIEIDSTNSTLYNLIGTIKYKQGLKLEGYIYFKKALSRDPKSVYPNNNLGFYYLETTLYDSAKHYLYKSIEFDPNYSNAYWNLKTLADSIRIQARKDFATQKFKLAVGKQKEVIEIYQTLIKSTENIVDDNDISGLYGSLAWYLLFINEFQEAIHSSLVGLKLDSTETWINTNLAHAYLLSGQKKFAEHIYRQFKDRPWTFDDTTKTFRKAFLKDLDDLEKAGIISNSMNNIITIRKMLSN